LKLKSLPCCTLVIPGASQTDMLTSWVQIPPPPEVGRIFAVATLTRWCLLACNHIHMYAMHIRPSQNV
jgi:hypothetical protein